MHASPPPPYAQDLDPCMHAPPHRMLRIWPSLMKVGPSFCRLSTAERARVCCCCGSISRPVSTALARDASQGAASRGCVGTQMEVSTRLAREVN